MIAPLKVRQPELKSYLQSKVTWAMVIFKVVILSSPINKSFYLSVQDCHCDKIDPVKSITKTVETSIVKTVILNMKTWFEDARSFF